MEICDFDIKDYDIFPNFGHFVMAETQLVVVPEMDDQIIREGSPLQVSFYFNSSPYRVTC